VYGCGEGLGVDLGVYYSGSWLVRRRCGLGCVLFGELAHKAWVWIWVCIIWGVGTSGLGVDLGVYYL